MRRKIRLSRCERELIRIVRAAVGSGRQVDCISLTPRKWRKLFKLCDTQGLTALVYDNLCTCKTDLPFDVKMAWGVKYKEITHRRKEQENALQELTNLLTPKGIKILLLKGLGTSMLYPKPELRESGDLDIYCFGRYDDVNKLLTEAGAEFISEDEKHSDFLWQGISVENHLKFNYDLNNSSREIGNEALQMMESAYQPMPGYLGTYIPSSTAAALHMMLHNFSHLAWSGIPLRNLVDWALLAKTKKDEIDAESLSNILKCAKLWQPAVILDSLSYQYLGYGMWAQTNNLQQSERESGIKPKQVTCPNASFLLYDLLRPVPSSSTTKNPLLKIHRKLAIYFRRKRKHELIYGEPFPDRLLPSILPKRCKR